MVLKKCVTEEEVKGSEEQEAVDRKEREDGNKKSM